VHAQFVVVGATYFETLRLRMLRGRDFTAADEEPGSGPHLAIVDVTLARKLFGDADPVGRQVLMRSRAEDPAESFTVVGVAPEIREDFFYSAPGGRVYVNFGGKYYPGMNLHIRTADGAPDAAMLTTIRQELQRVDERLPVFSLRTMRAQRDS